MKPYILMADLHLHNWSAFASTTSDGVNTRLKALLDEIRRARDELANAGGNTMIIAGDVFHVRGSIAPSVLNPTLDLFRELTKSINVVILAGNHDLEHKESNRLGSAITALEGAGCKVINVFQQGLDACERVVMIPWMSKIEDLKTAIADAAAADPNPGECDLILHAPIDGVIPGLPDHGLSPDWLDKVGFRRVFSGHYHHHKTFPGTNVTSIGALAHHTWSDVKSKAGFLLVSDTEVKWFKSHAPEFVEIDATTDPDDIPLVADGNYVRAKINTDKQKDIEELRVYLNDCGALGCTILAQKDVAAVARPAGSPTVAAGASIEVSIGDFIKSRAHPRAADLTAACLSILSEAQMAAV